MKRITIIIACMILSLASFAQLEIDYNYLNQQQKEIGSIIKAEVEAQARKQKAQTQQGQIQTSQGQAQTTQQQAIESYINKMSIEGQIRMEQINNPDAYIDRSITNRGSSALFPDDRNYQQNQTRAIRKEPIHSESLTSKSLQMLREANREYFSNEDHETTIDPNTQIPLFDAPSLGVPLWQDLEEEMDMETIYSELSPGQKATYDKMKKEILERKENAEYRLEIAKIDSFWPTDFDTPRYEIIRNSFIKYEAEKEIQKAEEDLKELEKLAREAVRNKQKK